MKKTLLALGLCATGLYAESFEEFKARAMDQSPYIQAIQQKNQKAQEEAAIITRYENPALSLEYASFKPEAVKGDSGYLLSYSQPIRLWGVGSDKNRLAGAVIESAQADYSQQKSAFTRDLSIAYTLYAKQHMLLVLAEEEERIAKTIFGISNARHNNGTIPRGAMLQSKVAYETVSLKKSELKLRAMQTYYDLLAFAGINEEMALDTTHDFPVYQPKNIQNSPDLLRLEAQHKKSLHEADVNDNMIEWMDLYVEHENEPDQDITRVGIALPLPFFNTNAQEKEIALRSAKETEYLIQNENTHMSLQLKRLKQERNALEKMQKQNSRILETELELLTMFEEGYKIANINLLELQDVKNRVIETKERLIGIRTGLNQNAITTNYILGVYNE